MSILPKKRQDHTEEENYLLASPWADIKHVNSSFHIELDTRTITVRKRR